MHRSIHALALVAVAAPAPLLAAAKVKVEGPGSWHLKRRGDAAQLDLFLAAPKLTAAWLERKAPAVESKDSPAAEAESPSGLKVQEGESVELDLAGDSVVDEIWIDVEDSTLTSKVGIQLTRVRSLLGELATVVTFHGLRGESEAIAKVAQWEGDTLTLRGAGWPRE